MKRGAFMLSTAKEVKEKTGYLKRSDLYTIGVGQAIVFHTRSRTTRFRS